MYEFISTVHVVFQCCSMRHMGVIRQTELPEQKTNKAAVRKAAGGTTNRS
nr:MAG TPA: hypothetical protein [Caudoviricetes sp.]